MGHINEKYSQTKRSWCAQEFESVDFNDDRLNKRLTSLAEALSEYPLNPINQACKDAAGAKAAYRFFANAKTEYGKILEAHIHQTCARAMPENTILVIQDTSFIDYTISLHDHWTRHDF